MSKRSQSALEATFAFQLKAVGIAGAKREFLFHPKRKWRFDFAWPSFKVAVEIEGGVWTNGRHTRGSGFIEDCEKYNAAVLLGWRVLRFTDEHLKKGTAIKTLEELLTGEN